MKQIISILFLISISINAASAAEPSSICKYALTNLGKVNYSTTMSKEESVTFVKSITPEFSWASQRQTHVPENKEFIDELEKEVLKLSLSVNSQKKKYAADVLKLIQEVRSKNHPLDKTVQLVSSFYSLLNFDDYPPDDFKISQMADKFYDLFRMNVKGYYPKFIFSFNKFDFADITLARDAGVVYIGVSKNKSEKFDNKEYANWLYTIHDKMHGAVALSVMAQKMSTFMLPGESVLEFLMRNYNHTIALHTDIFAEPVETFKIAAILGLFQTSHEQGRFLLSGNYSIAEARKHQGNGFYGDAFILKTISQEDAARVASWLEDRVNFYKNH